MAEKKIKKFTFLKTSENDCGGKTYWMRAATHKVIEIKFYELNTFDRSQVVNPKAAHLHHRTHRGEPFDVWRISSSVGAETILLRIRMLLAKLRNLGRSLLVRREP